MCAKLITDTVYNELVKKSKKIKGSLLKKIRSKSDSPCEECNKFIGEYPINEVSKIPPIHPNCECILLLDEDSDIKYISNHSYPKAIMKTDEVGNYYEVTIEFETNVKYGGRIENMDEKGYRRKLRALKKLSQENRLIKTKSQRDASLTSKYKEDLRAKIINMYYEKNKELAKRLFERINKMDPDHIFELQLNGDDKRSNLKMLHWFTNRRIGSAISSMLSDVPDGSRIKVKGDERFK